ncbi:MAG: zinc-dependent metalloprotease, partial [Deltaproteobacteria bacterium]|nr:zinc-dependent metalloprotease [Deltaproteobacteria bacterium]
KWDPVAYYVNDPSHPDAPVFDVQGGYFDVTTRALASPEVIEDDWWGDYLVCDLYGYWPAMSCNPAEVTLRHSFLKVTDSDYEPVHWDGAKMEIFGLFTVDRFGYDRGYGIVDDQWHRFAARWNLYERSHTETPCASEVTTPVGADIHRDEDGNGTEDECEAVGRGSRCDEFRGACTIALRDRQLRTIPWYVNAEIPADLYEPTAEVVQGWNDAMRVAVLAGRLAECRRTGEQGCEAAHGWPERWADDFVPPVGADSPAQVSDIFVLCHNPVDASQGDVAACGPNGRAPRLGDLRYNFMNVVPDPEFLGPWGIMVDAEDPLTGEKLSGSVNVWGAVTDRYALQLVDLLALLNGQLDPEVYIKGQNVSDWVAANQPGGPVDKPPPMSVEELERRRASFDPKVLEPYLHGLGADKPGAPPFLRHKLRTQALIDHGRLGPGNAALANRLRALQGTAIEAAMVSPELAQMVGHDPTAAPSAELIRRASPFGRANPTVQRDQRRAALLGRAKRHSCRIEAMEPDNMLGLAKRALALFPAPDPNDPAAVKAHREQVYNWARAYYTRGVFAHEMGHSMGLRHNFAASFDSLSYDLGYWQLRTQNGTVTDPCPDGTEDGTSCIGPRWRDPISDIEIDNDIGQYATSSVMDYPGDATQDFAMLGSYDRAALRLAYGGVVDVWNKPGVTVDGSGAGQQEAYLLTTFAANPGLTGIYYFSPVDPMDPYIFIHYSDYQNRFDLLSECSASDEPDAVLGQKCLGAPLDVVDFRDMASFAAEPDYATFSWGSYAATVDPTGRVRRGYQFSSDEYADAGNVPAFTGDAGADAYEITRFLETQLENRYVLDSFRRNRVLFNSWDTWIAIQYKYLDKIQQVAKTFAFGALLDGDPTQPTQEFLEDGYYGPLALAGSVA